MFKGQRKFRWAGCANFEIIEIACYTLFYNLNFKISYYEITHDSIKWKQYNNSL